MLRCDQLVVAGRGVRPRALDGVTFSAEPGDIVAVVGPANAGKSVLLAVLAGTRRWSAGQVRLDEAVVRHAGARRTIGYAADPPLAPAELTGAEWLTYVALHRSASPADRVRLVRWALELSGLGTHAGRRLGGLDRVGAQRLAFAAAAVSGTRLLVLDETLTGLDLLGAQDLRAAAGELASAGRMLVIAAGDVAAVERVATRALVLSRGQVAADIHMATLVQERVAELVLGGAGVRGVPQLLSLYPGAVRTGEGVAIPLTGGLSCEAVLAACRGRRIAVAGSRLRYRMLEDVLTVAARAQADGDRRSR